MQYKIKLKKMTKAHNEMTKNETKINMKTKNIQIIVSSK